MYIIYVWNGWIWRKIEYLELQKFKGKLCTSYMHRLTGFAEKLNIQRLKNLTGNCVHYICMECLDLQKNWISITAKIQREIVYIIYVRKVWIFRKIEYPELRKFNGKWCTLYLYGTSGFAEKLNIQNCKNSTRNCLHYICTEGLDFQKNWISRTAKRNGWICKKIEYLKLRKFNGKLGMLYVYGISRWAKKFEYPKLRTCKGKLCTLYMYRMFVFAEKLNVDNCVT